MTRIAFASDLHADSSPENRQFVIALREAVGQIAPDIFVIGGDIAAKLEVFKWTLDQFSDLPCFKIVLPGNHDVWIESSQSMLSGFDSGAKYFQHLPRIAAEAGFTFLHDQPVIVGNLAIAGCMGWYDYSFRNPALDTPDILKNYARGKWTNPRTGHTHVWNDVNFVWWLKEANESVSTFNRAGLCRSDGEITAIMAEALKKQLDLVAQKRIDSIVVCTHFVPTKYLLKYHNTARDYWNAYQGSTVFESIIGSCPQISHVLFGHRHEDIDCMIDKIRYLSRPVGYLAAESPVPDGADRLCVLDL